MITSHRFGVVAHRRFLKWTLCASKVGTVAVLLQLSLLVGHAQATISGSIVGTVMDTTGAVVPNARVIITNQSTGTNNVVITNGAGEYVAPYLQAGTYDVKVEAPQFASADSPNNQLDVGRQVRVDFQLKAGSATQVVEVTSATPLLDTESSDTSGVISDRQLEAIPLNGQIFSQALNVLPGVQAAAWSGLAGASAGAGAQTAIYNSVNGLPFEASQYYLDGVYDQEPVNDFINITPPIDSIQEMKVEMSNPTAAMGVYGGALVNMTLKSGTNDFHGAAYEFLRNASMNATPEFSTTKPPIHSNEFGVNAGGPIVKKRAFFFADYQGLYLDAGQTFNTFVPTDLMRQGIFSPSEGFPTIYNPKTDQPYINNQIPAGQWDPAATTLINQLKPWPEPNIYVGQNLNTIPYNFSVTAKAPQQYYQFDIKGDYQFADGGHLMVRDSYVHNDQNPANFGAPLLEGGNSNLFSQDRDHNAVVGYDRAFTPTLFMQVRLGFQRFDNHEFGPDFGTDYNNELGIPNGNIAGHPETSGLAHFTGAGFATTGSCSGCAAPSSRIFNDYQINANFTWVRGKHTLGFGADLRRNEDTLTGAPDAGQGNLLFSGNYTSGNGASTGVPFADLLLGFPNEVDRGFSYVAPAVRFPWDGVYFQDDYHPVRNLTINMGLRWDRYQQPIERHNYQSNFNPQTGLVDMAQPGNRVPNVSTWNLGLQPRVGFAYTMNQGTTVVRAGFGMSYFNDNFGATDGTLNENFPLVPEYINSSPTPYTPFWSLSTNGLQPLIPLPNPLPASLAPPAGTSVYYIPKSDRPDALESWNFGVEQQIARSMALDVAYVGNHGYELYINVPIDTPYTPGPGAYGPYSPRMPFYDVAPQLGGVTERTSGGDSHYDALQAKFTAKMQRGFWTTLSYTWSHTLSDTNVEWPYSNKYNYGPPEGSFLGADLRHMFVASYGYDLPFGRGRQFLKSNSWITDALAGGWTISGVTDWDGGYPLEIDVADSLLNTGTGNRANQTCSQVPVYGRITEWFDTSCFSAPAPYTFGNSGIGIMRGPGTIDFDMALHKNVSLGETRTLGLRADAFNIFNHPLLGTPNTTFGAPGFGQITGTSNAIAIPSRQLQLSANFQF